MKKLKKAEVGRLACLQILYDVGAPALSNCHYVLCRIKQKTGLQSIRNVHRQVDSGEIEVIETPVVTCDIIQLTDKGLKVCQELFGEKPYDRTIKKFFMPPRKHLALLKRSQVVRYIVQNDSCYISDSNIALNVDIAITEVNVSKIIDDMKAKGHMKIDSKQRYKVEISEEMTSLCNMLAEAEDYFPDQLESYEPTSYRIFKRGTLLQLLKKVARKTKQGYYFKSSKLELIAQKGEGSCVMVNLIRDGKRVKLFFRSPHAFEVFHFSENDSKEAREYIKQIQREVKDELQAFA